MAKKVTQKDIEHINDLYLEIGTYAGVARETGFSPSTVKRYIIPDYRKIEIVLKDIVLPPIDTIKIPTNPQSWLVLTPSEIEEIKIFKRNEVSI